MIIWAQVANLHQRCETSATSHAEPVEVKLSNYNLIGTRPSPPNPDPSGAVQKDAFAVANFDIQNLILEESQLPEIIQIPDPRSTTPNITLPGGVPRVIPAGRNISVPTHIQFTGDGTDLAIEAMTKRTLNAIIKTLTDYPLLKLEIDIDNVGSNLLINNPDFEQYRIKQSKKRGRKILEFLKRRGISPSRVRTGVAKDPIFEKSKQSNTRRNTQNFKIINN